VTAAGAVCWRSSCRSNTGRDHRGFHRAGSCVWRGQRPPSPDQAFWPGIGLDLTSAALTDLRFANASVVKAIFHEATFTGDAGFVGATFTGPARFDRVTFTGATLFDRAKVLHLDEDFVRWWPPGWTVQPDPVDPTHGTLTRARSPGILMLLI
jgi:hypothetical protein